MVLLEAFGALDGAFGAFGALNDAFGALDGASVAFGVPRKGFGSTHNLMSCLSES